MSFRISTWVYVTFVPTTICFFFFLEIRHGFANYDWKHFSIVGSIKLAVWLLFFKDG